MKTVKDLRNIACTLHNIVDSLIQVVFMDELYPKRNLDSLFMSPPCTDISKEPVEEQWFGDIEVMYGAS